MSLREVGTSDRAPADDSAPGPSVDVGSDASVATGPDMLADHAQRVAAGTSAPESRAEVPTLLPVAREADTRVDRSLQPSGERSSAEEGERTRGAAPEPATDGPAPSAPTRVLVVDDEAVTVDLLTFILRHAGYEVEGVTTCFDALARALATPQPDIILLDALMPFVSGVEVCRRLRAMMPPPQAPIGLFSSADEADVPWRQAGADGFLAKPFSVTVLADFVQQLHARARARRDESLAAGRASPAASGRGRGDASSTRAAELWGPNAPRERS